MTSRSKKEIATEFLILCAKGKSPEAFNSFADKNFDPFDEICFLLVIAN